MTTLEPIWRNFQSFTSAAEAAAYSENCIFSLATLEIDCPSGTSSFALTEREHPGVWRWAIVNAAGKVIDHGSEATQEGAKLASEGALALLALR
jgi:hypothetical protein